MAVIRPFKAVRPTPTLADKVAELPYDCMNCEEGREMTKDNPYSFLHVDKPEIDLEDGINVYDKGVYESAKAYLDKLIKDKVLIQDEKPKLYIYRQIMKGRTQTGIVACASIDDYLNNRIKKHENTIAAKETDRINHVTYCDAQTGPIFLTYRNIDEINDIVNSHVKGKPLYDFKSQDGVSQIVWVIEDEETIEELCTLFSTVENMYIADGHHRCNSAVRVGQRKRELNQGYTGDEEFNYFLSVIFPDKDLFIMDYNRVVSDLNGLTCEEYLKAVSEKFEVKEYSKSGQYKPSAKYNYGMYLDDTWYELRARVGTYSLEDPVAGLDVSILQDNLLGSILGIIDPRTDDRIDFVGGIRGLQGLERRVQKGMKVAFALYPPTIKELMDMADAGEVMPPKSTWFEPKLRSGLFIHKLK